MTHPYDVTHKAVLDYIRLVYGINVEFFRDRIAQLAETGIKEGSTGVIIEGVKLVIRDRRVINVIEKNRPSCDRRSRSTEEVLAELKIADPAFILKPARRRVVARHAEVVEE